MDANSLDNALKDLAEDGDTKKSESFNRSIFKYNQT